MTPVLHRSTALAWAAALLVCTMAACDTVHPSREGTLVLQGYLQAGQPLPDLHVSRTWSVAQKDFPDRGGVAGADVRLTLDGTPIQYVDDPDSVGRYVPEVTQATTVVAPMSMFSLSVHLDDEDASASGVVPPLIALSDVSVAVPDQAIEAVFLDTLDIGIDSLDISVDARNGYIYPVQVDLSWKAPLGAGSDDDLFWIETRLEPKTQFSSSIVDFFLLPKQILPEESATPAGAGMLRWRGVYAIPVDAADEPVPRHQLQVFLLRGDNEFARFETSRDSPERREPESNVRGGIGFVGGIAMDSLSLTVSSSSSPLQ